MKKIILQLSSVLLLLLLWQSASVIINVPLILPSPAAVFKKLLELWGQNSFWRSFLFTCLRCFIAFSVTMLLGSFLGILCGLNRDFYIFLEIPMTIVRSTPVVSFILIALFWFSSSIIPVFISVVMTLPIIITDISTGFQQIDKNLLKMAKVFRLTPMQTLFKIQLPGIKTHFLSGLISVFGLTWKVVAAGEVLSLPRNGIGTLLQRSQVQLESAEIIAVTIFYVAVSFISRKFPQALENLYLRHQQKHQSCQKAD